MDWVRGTVLGRRPEEDDLLLAMPPPLPRVSSGCSWEEERTSVPWGLGPMLLEAFISLLPTWTPRPPPSSIVDNFCVIGGGGKRERERERERAGGGVRKKAEE